MEQQKNYGIKKEKLVESKRESDTQQIRKILDRRHDVSVMLS